MDGDVSLPPPSTLIEDMAWCWWTRPRATRIGDAVFFGALDHEGGIVAARLDLPSRAVERCRLARFEDDDHNNPALLAIPGRPLVCLYSRHDATEGLRYRLSRSALDVSGWHQEQVLAFDGSTTYAEVHHVDDDIHLFTRVDETRWSWRMSSDWAGSWTPPRDLLAFDTDQQVYMASALCVDGRTMRVAVSGHPKDYEEKPLHDVWAFEVDLVTGEVRAPDGGRRLGNLRTGAGLPLDYPALDKIVQTPPDRTVNLFDVASGPVFEVGFVSKRRDDHSTRDAIYHVAAHRDGSWRTEDVTPAGTKFGYIDAGFYVGGMAFPDRAASGQVYLTRESDGLWHFELCRRDANARWTATPLVAPGPTRLTRPWAVSPPADGLAAVALALDRYPEDDYFGWLSHLVGVPMPKELQR